jgi:hypothetical protein
MRQRLALAAAMLGDPPILLLDEPANGLDPPRIIWMQGLLRRFAAEGRAVLVSSHLLGELAEVANRVIIIDRGRLVADVPLGQLLNGEARVVEVRCADPAAMAETMRERGAAVSVDGDLLVIEGVSSREAGEVASAVRAGPVALPFGRSAVWLTLLGCITVAVLFGVLGVAIGAIVRNQTVAIVGSLGWMVLVEPALFLASPTVFRWLPVMASFSLRRMPSGDFLPVGPATAVVIGVTAVALVAGLRLVERDDVTA